MNDPDDHLARIQPVQRSSLSTLTGPIAWSLYLAVPVAAWPWADGLPLGSLEAGAIALVWWVWAANRHLPAARVLATLTIVKLAAGALLVPGGFTARYYANDSWSPPVEHSIEFAGSDSTRRDERLAFGGDDHGDLPLHFLNHLRFNFYQPTEPRRDQLAYSVMWDGWIAGDDSAQPRTMYLITSDGVRGEIAIDEHPVIPMGDAADRTGALALSPGWHSITVRVAAPQGSGRRVEAGEVLGGERRPFHARRVFPDRVGSTRLAIDALVRWLARGVDLLVFVWLGVLVALRARVDWHQVHVGHLLWLGAIAEAWLFALPQATHVVVLSGGDDWLSYEHMARAIALGDPLLRQPGIAAGQGAPFYYQPLYPYFVALGHMVSGDGLFGTVFVQRVLLAATIGWVTAITRRLFGERTGWVALVVGGLLVYAKGGRWAGILLAEPLFMPLLACWTWLLVRTATEAPSWARLVLTGVLGGMATLTRSTLLLAWPLLMMVWSASLRVRRVRMTTAVVMIMIAVVSMATLRNRVVAGTFVPVASSGAINLAIGNPPPRPLSPAPPRREVLYDRLDLSAYGRTFVEYIVQMPREFAAGLGRKALYAIGFFERSGIGGEPGTSFFYVGMWGAALAGVIRLLRSPGRYRMSVVMLPGLAALSHFVAVVLIFPNVYADRLVLPLYPLLVPYAALGLLPLVEGARARIEPVSTAVLAALAACVFVAGLPRVWDVVTLLVIGATIIAMATGPRPRITPRGWLYVAYVAACVAAYAAAQYQGRGADIDLRVAFLLPLAVFAVARLAHARVPYLTALGVAAFAVVIAVALIRPALPETGEALVNDVMDVPRDLQDIVAGRGREAREELADDVRDVLTYLFRPDYVPYDVITPQVGTLAKLLLLGIWLQALLVSSRAAIRGRSAAAALCCAALVATYVIAVFGVSPGRWGSGSYSVAVLAVLFGLAESHPADDDARPIDSLRPSDEDKMLT